MSIANGIAHRREILDHGLAIPQNRLERRFLVLDGSKVQLKRS